MEENFTLDEIIALADKMYSDGMIGLYHKHPKENHGDSLAKFIEIELRETFNPDASRFEQLENARRIISLASDDLQAIADMFYEEASKYELH
jgi:hypothetical protein